MKNVFLFPNQYKRWAWLVLIPSVLIGVYQLVDYDFELDFLDWTVPWRRNWKDNFTNELTMVLILLSAIMVAFSKTQQEDEYVQKIRLDSLVWSMYFNYAVLFVGILGVYDLDFFNVLVLNLFTPLFIFIARFNILYYKR